MKLSQTDKEVDQGRVIAHGMDKYFMQQEKNMIKADKRRETMLHNAAEKALLGNNNN